MSSNMLDSNLNRRTLFAGVGTAGALAGLAAAMPQLAAPHPLPQQALPAQPVHNTAESPGSYRETDHVLRYYRSARV